MPMVSLVIGLPGETPEDIEATTRWVRSLKDERALIFPLVFAPISRSQRPTYIRNMDAAAWRLFETSYEFNFAHLPGVIRAEQKQAGLPLWWRSAVALVGAGYVPWWRILFAMRS
jgi:radical SAM superfamily enzyme YgiQ (UPF0313 family)